MSAITVLIIRHGEKPEDGGPPNGVLLNGARDDSSLIVRGWQRAGAWATLFGSGLNADYPKPSVIYAAKPDADSQRPVETIAPLADRLHLAPRIDFGQDQGGDLATEVGELTGVVLICWEHKRIAKTILPAFLGDQKPPGVPAKWDGSRFDVVLRLDRAVPGAPWSFRQIFPRLLAGDSDVPL